MRPEIEDRDFEMLRKILVEKIEIEKKYPYKYSFGHWALPSRLAYGPLSEEQPKLFSSIKII